MDLNQLEQALNVDVPDTDEAGPALLGKEPIIGSARRTSGGVVIRDEIREELDL